MRVLITSIILLGFVSLASSNVPVITNTVVSNSISPLTSTTYPVFDVEATDADPTDTVTYIFHWINPIDGSLYFDADQNTGIITVKPGAVLTAGQSFTVEVTATDGTDSSGPKGFMITIDSAANNPPYWITPSSSGTDTANPQSQTPTGAIYTFLAEDPEGAAITYSMVDWTPNNGGGNMDVNSDGTITMKSGKVLPIGDVYNLTVEATDGVNTIQTMITIYAPQSLNTAPTITNAGLSVDLTSLTPTGIIFDVEATDADNDPVTYQVVSWSPNDGGTYFDFNTVDGVITPTGTKLPEGTTYVLTVTASDGVDTSTPGTVTINTPPNIAPTITNSVQTVNLTSLTPTGTIFDVEATDAEGDPITYPVFSWNPNDAGTYFDFNTVDGVITLKPGMKLPADATYVLTVTASDGVDTSTPATFTINTAPNTPPRIVNPLNNGNDVVNLPTLDPTGTIFTFAAVDDEFDTISYELVNWNPPDGDTYFTFNTNDGTVTPTGTSVPPDSTFILTTRAFDGIAYSLPATLTINTPSAPNTPPRIVNPANTYTVVPLTSLTPTGNIFTFSTVDDEGDTIIYAVDTWNPADGEDYLNFNTLDGSVTLKPGMTLPSDKTFILTVSAFDGQFFSTSASVVITTEANKAPVMTTKTLSTSIPPTTTGVVETFVATDVNVNDNLIYIINSVYPSIASNFFEVDAQTGVISVKSGVDLVPGFYLISAVAFDGQLSSDSGTISIVVEDPPNTPPVITNPVNSGTTTVPLQSLSPTGTLFAFNAVDAENDPISYQVVSWNPNNGAYYFNVNPDGTVTAAPGIPLPGGTTYTLTVRATDGKDLSQTATITIITPDPNTAPIITNLDAVKDVEISTPASTIFTVSSVDGQNDVVQYTGTWSPSEGAIIFSLDPQTGDVTVELPAFLPQYEGQDFSLTVTATDGSLSSTPQTLTIRIFKDPNTAPIIANLDAVKEIETSTLVSPVIFTISSLDNENDFIQYTGTWNSPIADILFFFDSQSGEVKVISAALLPTYHNSEFILTVTASDGKLSSDPKTLTIRILDDPNTAPVITNLDAVKEIESTTPLSSLIFTVLSVDSENDAVQYTGTWNPSIAGALFSWNGPTGEVSVKSSELLKFYKDIDFKLTVTAYDGELLSTQKTLTVRIHDANLPPTIDNLPQTVTVPENPNGVMFYTVQATDPENDNVVFTGTWDPTWAFYYFSFDQNTGKVSSKASPNPTYANFKTLVFQLHVTASDGTSTSESKTLTFQMEPPSNTPPEFLQTYYFVTVNGRQPGTVVYDNFSTQVTDPDTQDTKTFAIVPSQWSQYFNINPSTGQITYSTTKDLSQLPSQFSLNVEVTDGAGAKDTTLVFGNILATSLPGFPNLPQTVSIPEGNSPSNVFTVQPPVSTPLTYSMTQSPMDVPFSINPTTGVISYVGSSPIDYESLTSNVITLKIKAMDGSGTSTPEETLTINIQDINEAPVFNNLAYPVTVNAGSTDQTVFTNLQASVNDPDMNDVVTLQLLPGQYADYFYIDAKTGTIRYAKNTLGVNLPSPVRLTVMAKDRNGLSSTANVDVTIIGQIINNIEFTNIPTSVDITTSQASSQPVYDVNASGTNLVYSIKNNNLFPQFVFQIDPSSGVVSLRPNYNIQSMQPQPVELIISVTDGSQTVDGSLIINVGSSSINQPPSFNSVFMEVTASDGPAGTFVTNAGSATDPDGDSLTYQINLSKSGTVGSLFNINPNTVDITFKEDYYLKDGRPSQVGLTITATDTGGLSADVLVLITFATQLKFNNLPNVTNTSRFQTASPIYQAVASGGLPPFTYTLENNTGPFSIDPQSGEVWLTNILLTAVMPELRIKVTDAKGISITETLRINII